MLQLSPGLRGPQRPMLQSNPASAAARDQLLAEIARLRDAIFALTEASPGLRDRSLAEVPVRLQAAAYELGQAERMLDTQQITPGY
jgi:hypothetical protein